jgi:GT2 family glycosyltransferase
MTLKRQQGLRKYQMDKSLTALKSPSISVVIPAYNQALYISEAVQSVLRQTYSDFELIVVDDGSTDETPDILGRIQDPRMRIIRQSNAGLSAARNTGLQESIAPFVTFLDSDDYFFSNKLEIQMKYLTEHPDIGMVVGRVRYIDPSGNTILEPDQSSTSLTLPDLLFENPICVSAILLRRSSLDMVGEFDESLHACEDFDLWLRLLDAGCQMAWVDQPVVCYRIHPDQMTRQSERMRIAIFSMLGKFFGRQDLAGELLAYKSKAYSTAWIHAAAYAYLSSDGDKGQAYLAEALRLDPTLRENHYQRLIDIITSWANDPRAIDPRIFLQCIIDNPPAGEAALVVQLHRRLADATLGTLFEGSQNAWKDRRRDFFYVIRYRPGWLLNRGFLRMFAIAWLDI